MCANPNSLGRTCAISVIRITTLHASITNMDVTWGTPSALFWSIAEATCAIICVCIPTLRPLVTQSYKSWPRPKEANEAKEPRGRVSIQQSYEMSCLETQASVDSSANVDDERVRSEVSLDKMIQKPSSCHLPDCGPKPDSSHVV